MIAPSDSPFIPLAVAAVLLVLIPFMRSITALRTIEVLLCVSCFVSLVLFGYWIWIFREGLGFFRIEHWPKLAVHFSKPLFLVVVVLVLSAFLYRLRVARLRGPII